jgi:hypothetical protein
MDKLTRIGAPWTKEEEETILAQVASGLHIAEIAIAQKRTTGGIRARLTRIACLLVEQKMSVYEAAGRTGIKVVRIQEALKRKLEEESVKVRPSKLEFTFTTTTSREELLALPMKHKMSCLQSIADLRCQELQGHAIRGETSYLWEIDETKLAQYTTQRGLGRLGITIEEVLQALRARFPGCKVERAEDWVNVSTFTGQLTRVLKSGIKIDWS